MKHRTHLAVCVLFILSLLLPGVVAAQPDAGLIPRIVDTQPYKGEELPLDGTVTFYFNQAMDRESVEAAFEVSPDIEGTLEWPNPSTLVFKPDVVLEHGMTYEFKFSTDATNEAGTALADPFKLELSTIGFLEVSSVIPAPLSTEVEADSVITVIFDRPIVPLVIEEEKDSLPQPLTFEPEVEGEGEWLNTSIYVFRPEEALWGGVTYEVTVNHGLTDISGAVLKEPFTWRFTTIKPRVISVFPRDDDFKVSLNPSVTVRFNQPMDVESTEKAFTLTGLPDIRVLGTFEWNDDYTDLTFTPDTLLDYDTLFTIALQPDARSARGDTVLGGEVRRWDFRTVPLPSVQATNPSDGDMWADPYGSFNIYFASPMDRETLTADKITVEPEPEEGISVYYNRYDQRLSVSFNRQPETEYTITIAPGMADPYGTEIEEERVVTFKTRELDPIAAIRTPQNFGLYTADDEVNILTVWRNISEMNVTVFDVPFDTFVDLTGPGSWQEWRDFVPEGLRQVNQWTVEAPEDLTKNESYVFTEALKEQDGGPIEPGLYYVMTSSPETANMDNPPGITEHLLAVISANVTIKLSSEQAFAWITDVLTGEPIADATVTVHDSMGMQQLARGRTDENGVFLTSIPLMRNLYDGVFVEVQGRGVYGIGYSGWTQGIDPWQFDVPVDYYRESWKAYLYTDRPIYRPGQPVYYRGILRERDDMDYYLPPFEILPVTIRDSQYEIIYEGEVEVNEFGTFSGEFQLDDNAPLGYYAIQVGVDSINSGIGFSVAEYRPPEYQITATAAESEVIQGETVQVLVDAAYFFGGAVSNAPVSYNVLSANYYFNRYDGPGYWDFTDYSYEARDRRRYGGYGALIAEGSGTTDANGEFLIEFPADISDNNQSQTFTIEATVTDESGQYISGRTSVVVHKGKVYLGLQPERYISTAGTETLVNVVSVDTEGEIVPEQEVEWRAVHLTWANVQEKDEEGRTVWRWKQQETDLADGEITTDEDGMAQIAFTPEKGGTYKVYAETADEDGNAIISSTFVWVAGTEYVSWRQTNDKSIELIADSDSYEIGDTAEILIASPWQGQATALITIERADVIDYEIVTMETNSLIYEVPITEDLAPTAYVSVMLVKGVDEYAKYPEFRVGVVQLPVNPERFAINIELIPDREKVGPREEVTYTVRTTDYKGDPVSAEVGLWLSDLATLSLMDRTEGPILPRFYGEQGLGVQTASALTLSIEELVTEMQEREKGGGGGGGGMGVMEVRTDFVDTPYWNAHLVTDEDGEAEITVTLPDNLTTWRMDARAVTKETLVGQATVDIISTKPLLVRPATPRFFVSGDELSVSVVVNNNTDDDMEARVSVTGSGLEFGAEQVEDVLIPANGRVEVSWPVVITSKDWVDLTFGAKSDEYEDAAKPVVGIGPERQIPVYLYEAPETVGTGGTLTEAIARTEAVIMPSRYEVTQGELVLTLDRSLAAATLDGLDYLKNYPHQCTEQTVSRFLPNILTVNALVSLGHDDEELRANLDEQVSLGLQQLYNQQHSDGGWGWFVTDDSNALVTAYALLGLVQAESAGYAIREEVIARATAFLMESRLSRARMVAEWELNREAFITYVLARAGEADPGREARLYEERERMALYARAYLALSINLSDPGDGRLDTLMSDILNAAVLSANGAHWEESYRDWWNWNSDTRTTAIVLKALIALDPDLEIIPNVVRWLMVARDTDTWETTQETAWAVMALTDWMVTTQELQPDYIFNANLNGDVLYDGAATPENVQQTEHIRVDVADLLTDQANAITFARSEGPGNLYYTSYLTVYLPVEQIEPLNRGIIINRQYSLASDEDEAPITSAQVGDEIRVTLTIIAPNDLHYVMIEDPLPAGAEAINRSLNTTSVVGERPGLNRTNPLSRGWGWWWFSRTELRDEKVLMYATYLPAGTYEYTYAIRAGFPGTYRVIPPTGQEFYFPEVYGRGAGALFTIEEAEE